MFTRVFLAAGVAALAIATPASAGPHGGGGGGNGNGGGGPHGGGPPAAAPAAAPGGGGGHGHGGGGGGGGPAPVFIGGGGGGGHGHGGGSSGGGPAPIFMGGGGGGHGNGGGGGHAHGGGFSAPQMRVERQQSRGFERQQFRGFERQQARGFEPQQARGFERRQAQVQARGFERQQARSVDRRQAQARSFSRPQGGGFDRQSRMQARGFDRSQAQAQALAQTRGTFQPQQARGDQFGRQALAQVNNDYANNYYGTAGRGFANGCPPGLAAKNNGCLPPGQAAKLLGAPLAAAAGTVPLSVLPQSLAYYYPDTSDYYWRTGDGYLYQVDRGSNLIASLLPLIGGGYMPGSYLPQDYMSSYVPSDWGMNSFYPDYGGLCNRYYDGVIYQTDCASGLVEDVIPTYAAGYGVGQMLPASYDYYNVPLQYRDVYYDTPDAGYWYAPGAIYQYDPNSSVITSVAALLSPGFSVGQPLPMGYDAYNVPYDYRATYYDTPNAWYRYNNGYIYQVDPTTQIVIAIVAALLT